MALLLFEPPFALTLWRARADKEERTMTAANPDQPQPKASNVVPMTARPAQPPAPDRTSMPPGKSDESQTPDEPGYGHGV
jgi:hypothetical protein